MITTQQVVITPSGQFTAMWDENEDLPVMYTGDDHAIAFFKTHMALNIPTGRTGAILKFDSLEPDDLYGFCQSQEFGILVMPDPDDMLVSMRDEAEGDEHANAIDAVANDRANEILTQLNTSGDPTGELRKELAQLMPLMTFASDEDREAFNEAVEQGGEWLLDSVGGPVIAHANESVLPMGEDIRVILKAALVYAKTKFRDKRVRNASDGTEILIDLTGIKHGLSNGAGLLNALVSTDLMNLVAGMKYMRSAPDKLGRTEIVAIHYYHGMVEVQGKAVAVGVVVREKKDGRHYYHHFELRNKA